MYLARHIFLSQVYSVKRILVSSCLDVEASFRPNFSVGFGSHIIAPGLVVFNASLGAFSYL